MSQAGKQERQRQEQELYDDLNRKLAQREPTAVEPTDMGTPPQLPQMNPSTSAGSAQAGEQGADGAMAIPNTLPVTLHPRGDTAEASALDPLASAQSGHGEEWVVDDFPLRARHSRLAGPPVYSE